MKIKIFFVAIASALIISACSSNTSSFYDQLSDEQKAEVSLDGFQVLQCVGITNEELNKNGKTYNLEDGVDALKYDIALLAAHLKDTENIKFEDIKTTEKPFMALTLGASYNGGRKVIYYFEGDSHCGYAMTIEGNDSQTGEEHYEIDKARVMTWAAEKGLVASDWQKSTTEEEQLVYVLMYFSRIQPSALNAMMKFTPITINGKPCRVTAVLGH